MSPADDGTRDGLDREFSRVDQPRGDRSREWELFLRDAPEEPLRHVGSVAAPTADVAREKATTLFGWRATALWLCPADETVRLVAAGHGLEDRGGTGATQEAEDR